MKNLQFVILLVEDEAIVRRVVKKKLEGAGYIVSEAASGDEAITTARSLEILDLVITDVSLPGMTARQLVERLSSERPKLLTLFMSGSPKDYVLDHGLLPEGAAFLEKSDIFQKLIDTVQDILAPGARR